MEIRQKKCKPVKRFKVAGVSVVGAMVMAAVLGCGASDESVSPGVQLSVSPDRSANSGSNQGAVPSEKPKEHDGGTVSLVKGYESFDKLWGDTDFSVRGVAGAARVEVVEKTPFTVTDFKVAASSDPSMVGATITIRQTGSLDYLVSGLTDLLVEGKEYLLMVFAFNWASDGPPVPNQYVITGEQAAWELTSDGMAAPIFYGEASKADEIRRVLEPEVIEQVLATR